MLIGYGFALSSSVVCSAWMLVRRTVSTTIVCSRSASTSSSEHLALLVISIHLLLFFHPCPTVFPSCLFPFPLSEASGMAAASAPSVISSGAVSDLKSVSVEVKLADASSALHIRGCVESTICITATCAKV
jgi:hypothetical protein